MQNSIGLHSDVQLEAAELITQKSPDAKVLVTCGTLYFGSIAISTGSSIIITITLLVLVNLGPI